MSKKKPDYARKVPIRGLSNDECRVGAVVEFLKGRRYLIIRIDEQAGVAYLRRLQ